MRKKLIEVALPLEAKATDAGVSTVVVVSFDARWLEPIIKRQVRLVLRKRVPRSTSPHWMYVYINSPESVLMARARVKQVVSLSLRDAIERRNTSILTTEEINKYFGGAREIGAYELGDIQLASNPLQLMWLRKHMTFNPPQSFFFLAVKAQEFIDKNAGF